MTVKLYKLQDRREGDPAWRDLLESDHPDALADLARSLSVRGVEHRVVATDTGETIVPPERCKKRR